jgi:hypothetical protein
MGENGSNLLLAYIYQGAVPEVSFFLTNLER